MYFCINTVFLIEYVKKISYTSHRNNIKDNILCKGGFEVFIETFSFDEISQASLTVYLHEENPEFSRVKNRPFILVIPGGGYNFCSDREGEPIALQFVAHGYHAGVLRYHVGKHRDFRKALEDGEKKRWQKFIT